MAAVCGAHFVLALPSGAAVILLIISIILLFYGIFHNHVLIWLSIAIASYAWASAEINRATILTQPIICQAIIELVDFPLKAAPTGEKVKAKIIKPLDCPVKSNAKIMVRAYRSPHWQLTERYHVQLKFLPSTRRYLGREKIDGYATLLMLNGKQASSAMRLNTWRAHLSSLIKQRYHSQTARWWQALLIGNRSELTARDWQILRRSGTTHLLAISGLHLAIVLTIAFWLIQVLSAYCRSIHRHIEPRSLALLGALLIGFIYSLLSGGQPPVMRAWIMFAVFAMHWRYAPLRSGIQALLLTAIILLISDVYIIFSASAWLSFYATAIVILSYRRVKYCRPSVQWLSMQAIITIALWPLVWALFGGISLLSYVVNIIVVPWLGVMLILGYLGLVLEVFTALTDGFFTQYLQTIYFFAKIEFSYFDCYWQPTLLSAFFVCSAFIFGLVKGEYRLKYMGWVCALLAIITSIYAIYPRNDYKILQQSPLLGIVTHNRHTYLINAGYRGRGIDQAQTILFPYLRQRGLKPQTLILTESSKRATTALNTVLNQYPDIALVSTVITNKMPFTIQYCPQDSEPPLTFIKSRHCEAIIANKWHIK